MDRPVDAQNDDASCGSRTGPLPAKPRIPAKWIFYAILLFALLHMVFFFAQTFFGS